MSGRVDSDTSESGKVENVGVAVKIASSYFSVIKLFPLPVCVAAILISDVGRCRPMSADVGRCRPMSGHVGNARSRPGVVKNMAVAVEIASASLSVQKLLILPFLAAAMLDFSLPVLPEIA